MLNIVSGAELAGTASPAGVAGNPALPALYAIKSSPDIYNKLIILVGFSQYLLSFSPPPVIVIFTKYGDEKYNYPASPVRALNQVAGSHGEPASWSDILH